MSPLQVAQRLRARSGKGNIHAPNVCLLTNVSHRLPLYLLVETQSGDDAISSQLVAAAADAYRQARGSQTGALLAAVRAAQTSLRQSPSYESPQIGLSALLLNKDEAVLAQVEPSALWVLHEGKLLRWPEESAWLNAERFDTATRKGGLETSEPQLIRVPLSVGDRLMLGTSSIGREVGELLIAEALAQPDPSQALHDLVPDLSFTALSVVPDGKNGKPLTFVKHVVVRNRPARPLTRHVNSTPPASEPQQTVPRQAVSPPRPRVAEPQYYADDDDEADDGPSFTLPSFDLRPYLAVVGITFLFFLKILWSIISVFLRLLSRALPDREPSPTLRTTQAHRPVMASNPLENRVLVGLALAIPVLAVLSVAILRNQAGAGAAATPVANVANVLQQATAVYQGALNIQDPDSRKAELLKAKNLVDQAVSASPRDTSAKELQSKIGNELDKLSNISKFFFYPVLYSFDEKDSHPASVIARGTDVYVLDNGLNRLYKFVLNDAKDGLQPSPTRSATSAPTPNPVVMRQGDERGSIVIGGLTDIFWAAPGGGRSGNGVLTLTSAKQVVEYLPSKGITVLTMGAAAGWKEATLAESFIGNLYVLDANANRILKFAPTGEDYRNAPSDYVLPGQKVDFAGAADMAVDGFVWVLLADGTILKFDTGNLLPFDKKGLEVPLRKPTAIVSQQNSQYIWVADAGNRRIVQFTKNGDFVRQLKPDDPNAMSDLRGLAVDEAAKRFYFVNGNKLYMGTLQN